jgi:hypothetical protein
MGMELLLLDGFVFALFCFIAICLIVFLELDGFQLVGCPVVDGYMFMDEEGKERTTPLRFVPLLLPEFHSVITTFLIALILRCCSLNMI